MFVEHLLWLLLVLIWLVVHQVDASLQVVVLSFQRFVLFALVVDGHNQFLLHFRLRGQVTNAAVVILLIVVLVHILVVEVLTVLLAFWFCLAASSVFSRALKRRLLACRFRLLVGCIFLLRFFIVTLIHFGCLHFLSFLCAFLLSRKISSYLNQTFFFLSSQSLSHVPFVSLPINIIFNDCTRVRIVVHW